MVIPIDITFMIVPIDVRNGLQEERKSCWRQLEVFQEQLQEAKQELERGKQQLNSSLPRSITQGLATVERIAEEKGMKGYYGPLIDNIRLKTDAYRTAVEVAAGNSLFHVIVDTDTTAAYLMKELERRKAGRLTFLPLNRLRNPEVQYPESTDVRSLTLVALEYEAEFEQVGVGVDVGVGVGGGEVGEEVCAGSERKWGVIALSFY